MASPTPSKEELGALRIVVAQGINLHEALNRLALSFDPASSAQHKVTHWQLAVSALSKFMRETVPQTGKGVLPLLDSLGGFLDDIQKGKFATAEMFPRASGQQTESLSENNLVMCCVAITLLNRSGITLEAACRKIARLAEKYQLTFPPRKGRSHVETWKRLQGWRNQIISAEKHPHLTKLYEDFCKRYASIPRNKCEAEAELLIKTVGENYCAHPA
jgi:hypothetical protein